VTQDANRVAGPGTAGEPRLLADVGGTNARFAWAARASAEPQDVLSLPTRDYASLADAIDDYLRRLGRAAPAHCAIAIANPVLGDQVRMTNHPWSFSISALQARFGFARLRVLNDFTALALALPSLREDEVRQFGGKAPVPGETIGLIGPGTGLGVSGLVADGRGNWVPIRGEGGHATLPGCTVRENAVLQWIGQRHGHPSAERVISGPGLEDIHRALQAIDAPGSSIRDLDAAQITSAATRGGDARCRESLDLFYAFLGTAAGNLALTLGARGGVYIGGGIVPRLGADFHRSIFRARFEAKGRFTAYLAEIPVFVINARQSPALRGAASALATD